MTARPLIVSLSAWRARPLASILREAAAWVIVAAVVVAMTTPRMEVAGLRVTLGDVLGVLAGALWLLSLPFSPGRPILCRAARWPGVILAVGLLSLVTAANPRAAAIGVVELSALWLLPALALPNLIVSARSVERILLAVSVGSLLAAASNLIEVVRIGFAGGVPVVWGAVDYFQGYFQVLGLAVAAPRLGAALREGRVRDVLGWILAVILNVSALLVTQTRGAWLAAALVVAVFAVLQRGGPVLGLVVVVIGMAGLLSPDFASRAWERVESIFMLDARLAGFESSIGRIGLVLTAWAMFASHPILGVGLKNFVIALPAYAPAGMPFEIEMGITGVLTPIEGPHSTYLSLMAETGAIGALAFVAWVIEGAWRQYRTLRTADSSTGTGSMQGVTLLAAVCVVAVYSFFSEMNETGALPLVYLLVLAGSGVGADRSEAARG